MKEIKFVLSLMTPQVWLAALLAALVLIGAGGAVGYRVADGLAEIAALKVEGERAAERLTLAQERLTHAAQLAAEVRRVKAIEQQWKDDLGDVAELHKERMDDANAKITALRADVLTGAVRLSIAVKAGPAAAAGNCAASGNPAVAGSAVEETRAELVPQVAYDLIGIAADGDDAVRDFNACHDAYEALRLRAKP